MCAYAEGRSPSSIVAKQMVHAWNEGMGSLRSPKRSVVFSGLDEAIAQAGFSEPEKAEMGREVLGAASRACAEAASR